MNVDYEKCLCQKCINKCKVADIGKALQMIAANHKPAKQVDCNMLIMVNRCYNFRKGNGVNNCGIT